MTNSNGPSSYNKLTYIQKATRINRKLRAGDITFLANPKYFALLDKTHAAAIVTGRVAYFIRASFSPVTSRDSASWFTCDTSSITAGGGTFLAASVSARVAGWFRAFLRWHFARN
jgi:hypothetical protein